MRAPSSRRFSMAFREGRSKSRRSSAFSSPQKKRACVLLETRIGIAGDKAAGWAATVSDERGAGMLQPTEIQNQLIERITQAGEAFEQFDCLLGLAAELDELPEQDKRDDVLVSGCQSQVWLYLEWRGSAPGVGLPCAPTATRSWFAACCASSS